MAKKELIIQGFTTRTHIDAIRELFTIPNIQRVVLSVAFVCESGVQEIEGELTLNSSHTTIFAGIRNGITSHQALKFLHSIIGNRLFIVDTGARNLLFHPKLYYACGDNQARLIVGSANLTLGGLNNNIEASVVLDFDLTDEDDKATVDEIETLLLSFPTDFSAHVVKVRTVAELDDLLLSGRIIDETAFPVFNQTSVAIGTSSNDTIPRIKLKVPPLYRTITKARATPSFPSSLLTPVNPEFELIWESKPLTRRDLIIPDEDKTNPTGSINLDKGWLAREIDHRHYFRDDVFSNLSWTRRSATVDEAIAKFQLILKGVNYGEFDLAIRHTTSTTTRAYEQRNAMTRLSWGAMSEHIARPDLIGRALSLYRDKADLTRFLLEID